MVLKWKIPLEKRLKMQIEHNKKYSRGRQQVMNFVLKGGHFIDWRKGNEDGGRYRH